MSEAETVRELIETYDDNRLGWIIDHGSDVGFDEWFTGQVCEYKTLPAEVVTVLDLAVAYLEHPDVVAMPFALNSKVVAKRIRKIMEAQR